jgi:VWFA-related protein
MKMQDSCKMLLNFITILLALCQASPAQSGGEVASPVPVSLTVTITDGRKEPVSTLPQRSFTISDDTGVREITSFSSDDAPTSVAVLIDLSGSIERSVERGGQRKKVKFIIDALSQFVQKGHPANEYFVIGFDAKPYLFLDGVRDVSAALSGLQGLAFEKPGGLTALYDTCLFGIEKVSRGAYRKQAILLISDGRDNRSQYKLKDLRRALKENGVLFYSVNITRSWWEGASLEQWNQEGSIILEELATLTGGAVISPNGASALKADLGRIATELRHQYLISFLPAKGTPDQWHPLLVKVSLPADESHRIQKVSVRSRKGYSALASK